MNLIFRHIRRVPLNRRFVVFLRSSLHNPADMRPIRTVARRVRIVFGVGVRVVQTVRGHPFDRARLNRERAAKRQKIFKPFRSLKAPVR